MALCRVFNYNFLSKFGKCCDKHKETTDEWNPAWVTTLKCDYICAAFPASIKKVLSESNFAIVHFFRIDMMKRIAIECLLRIVYEYIWNAGIAWSFLIRVVIFFLVEIVMVYGV